MITFFFWLIVLGLLAGAVYLRHQEWRENNAVRGQLEELMDDIRRHLDAK